MPKLVVQATVTVIREGKRVTPPIGKSFNFTDEEATYIRKQHPLGLRKPVNEDAAVAETPAGGESEKEAGALDEGKTANISPKKPKKAKAKGAPIPADEKVEGDDADDDDAADTDEDEDI